MARARLDIDDEAVELERRLALVVETPHKCCVLELAQAAAELVCVRLRLSAPLAFVGFTLVDGGKNERRRSGEAVGVGERHHRWACQWSTRGKDHQSLLCPILREGSVVADLLKNRALAVELGAELLGHLFILTFALLLEGNTGCFALLLAQSCRLDALGVCRLHKGFALREER